MSWALRGYTLAVFLFMHVPILVIVVFSFSQGTVLALPIKGWTLDWYRAAWADARLREALRNSLEVACAATAIATGLGTLAAFALTRFRFPGRDALRAAIVLPILLPGIVTGVAMLAWFASMKVPLGLATVVAGHATFGFPVVFNTVAARVARLPRSLEEAAADLGATPAQAFTRVVFPAIRSAVLAGALLAFTLSFDEIVVTIFLTGSQNTLPTEIWARLRFGMTPEINAVVTLVLLASGALVVLSQGLAAEE